MDKITVIIPAQNNEDYIARCLDSVTWADEVILVDSFSTDRTVQIAESYGIRVLQHEYENYARQNNWVIPQAEHPWIFILDSDETITPGLRDEIKGVLENGSEHAAFKMRRRNKFMDKEMRGCGWDSDWECRLFRKGKGKFADEDVHARFLVDGTIGRMKTYMTHDTYASLEDYLAKFQRYTTWSANKLEKKGIKVRWYHLSLRPGFRFFKMYFLQYGFTQRMRGFILSMLGMMSVFMKYAKLWERQRKK
jgi:glycosyltransferase involved in cell wall biosynthesis